MNGKKENIDKLEDDFQEENSKETIKNSRIFLSAAR